MKLLREKTGAGYSRRIMIVLGTLKFPAENEGSYSLANRAAGCGECASRIEKTQELHFLLEKYLRSA
ncbi:MAG: hypothetical protein A2010_04315 [Nitrospirae bacterium GWD2_57_9]|nr:MAG: hypothetical protein A2010_04315 [Nitrospirae bacterium GWD2_57_9]